MPAITMQVIPEPKTDRNTHGSRRSRNHGDLRTEQGASLALRLPFAAAHIGKQPAQIESIAVKCAPRGVFNGIG